MCFCVYNRLVANNDNIFFLFWFVIDCLILIWLCLSFQPPIRNVLNETNYVVALLAFDVVIYVTLVYMTEGVLAIVVYPNCDELFSTKWSIHLFYKHEQSKKNKWSLSWFCFVLFISLSTLILFIYTFSATIVYFLLWYNNNNNILIQNKYN